MTDEFAHMQSIVRIAKEVNASMADAGSGAEALVEWFVQRLDEQGIGKYTAMLILRSMSNRAKESVDEASHLDIFGVVLAFYLMGFEHGKLQ